MCGSKYQVQDSLRGKPMRCPLITCKHVFIVGAALEPSSGSRPADPARPATNLGRQQSGSVGDMIPLLSVDEPARPAGQHVSEMLPLLHAEPMEPEPLPVLEPIEPPRPTKLPSWHEAPPVRRGTQTPTQPSPEPLRPPERKKRRPVVQEKTESEDPAKPRVLDPGAREAPPVRRGQPDEDTEANAGPRPVDHESSDPDQVDEAEPLDDLETVHQPRGRMAKFVIFSLVGVSFCVLGGGAFVLWILFGYNEENMAKVADEQYAQELFRSASEKYRGLAERFDSSERLPYYKFRQELSDIRHQVSEKSEKPESPLALLDRIEALMKAHKKDRLLQEHRLDVGDAIVKLMVEYCSGVAIPTDESPLAVLARANTVVAAAQAIKASPEAKPIDWSKMESAFASVQKAVSQLQQKKRILKRLDEPLRRPSFAALRKVEEILKEEEQNLPGVSNLPEVQGVLSALYDGHFRSIKYVETPAALARTGGLVNEPAILFDPLIKGTPGNAPPDDKIVLALTRGVLYALMQSNGEVKWAMRVGIDTTALPVRVPARDANLERILVLSSDTATLSAVNTDGALIWRYVLGSPSLGTPVIVGQRAYLATEKGNVHEIELVQGKLLGRYNLGQRLVLGGTREPGTNRIYFPANHGCVYIIDVVKRECEKILYTRHPARSLRGELVILPSKGEDTSGFLILNQTNGLRAMQLRVFNLPISKRDAPDLVLEPKARLEGWTWFPPYHDPEKLVMLSDAGVLGLFGIKQSGNSDKALFPLLPGGGLSLSTLLNGADPAPGRIQGRAEVVQVQGDDLWVLGADHLQRLRLAWNTAVGPQVAPAWKDPLEVGSPLHRSQTVEDRSGKTSLVLVTQPPRRSTTWATSVDDEKGVIRWRRQLGLVCARAPMPIKMPKGEPLFLALDQGGALFSLDPERYVVRGGSQWLIGSKNVFLAGPMDENLEQEPTVLPADDGKSVYVVACPGGGKNLVVRDVSPVANKRRLRMKEYTVKLPATLGGTPALVGTRLVLPLANGVLAGLTLPLKAEVDPESGSEWRAPRAVPESRGHVVALGGNRFLTTDGGSGLMCWEWPAPPKPLARVPLPKGEEPTLALPGRIVSAPVRLPTNPGDPLQVCVADSSGKVWLIEVKADGDLEAKKSWAVGGVVTTGPFLQETPSGLRIGCIVDRVRLVWLDPTGDKLPWVYATRKGDAIVGRPRLAEKMIVVADQSGLYVGLDPVTGKPLKADGYLLQGSVAPVASPVEFNEGRLLAPLSDGTVMLLSADRLRKK